jgi:hypothetical protein
MLFRVLPKLINYSAEAKYIVSKDRDVSSAILTTGRWFSGYPGRISILRFWFESYPSIELQVPTQGLGSNILCFYVGLTRPC